MEVGGGGGIRLFCEWDKLEITRSSIYIVEVSVGFISRPGYAPKDEEDEYVKYGMGNVSDG